MNILHTVELYHPSVGGAQEVVKQISEQLVRRGHTVTVATKKLPGRQEDPINGVVIKEFDITGNTVYGFSGETSRYQQFLIDGQFDIMMNYAAQQWAMDLALPILDKIPYAKIMIPCGFSKLYDPSFTEYYAKMPEYMYKYNRLVFHAQKYRDINFAHKHGLKNITIIPNGASQEEFSTSDSTFRNRYGIPENIPLLLTVSNHNILKGHRYCTEVFQQARIGPSVLVIIGGMKRRGGCLTDCFRRSSWVKVTTFGKKRVILLDPPRQDVVAAFHAADIFIFCSRLEYSPLVLYEALASKTPFVSSDCGNAGEIARWTGGGVVIPSTPSPDGLASIPTGLMANEIEKLIKDSSSRQHFAEVGHEAWINQFTWEKLAAQYEKLYQSEIDKGLTLQAG